MRVRSSVCLSVSVCLFVTSEFSGMGYCSATLLSPTWRALPGGLHRLLLELMQSVVGEEKP